MGSCLRKDPIQRSYSVSILSSLFSFSCVKHCGIQEETQTRCLCHQGLVVGIEGNTHLYCCALGDSRTPSGGWAACAGAQPQGGTGEGPGLAQGWRAQVRKGWARGRPSLTGKKQRPETGVHLAVLHFADKSSPVGGAFVWSAGGT